MKSILILALILSSTVSALADSSQFLPKRALVPADPAANSGHATSLYPAYSRANPRRESANATRPAQSSAAMPMPHRPYRRDYRS